MYYISNYGNYFEHNGESYHEKRLSEIVDIISDKDIFVDDIFFENGRVTFQYHYMDYKLIDCPSYGKVSKRGFVSLSELGLNSNLILDIILKNYDDMTLRQIMTCSVLGVVYG